MPKKVQHAKRWAAKANSSEVLTTSTSNLTKHAVTTENELAIMTIIYSFLDTVLPVAPKNPSLVLAVEQS